MLKRLYKRFLEWALAPVLGPVAEAVDCLQAQACFKSADLACLSSQVEALRANIEAFDVTSGDAPPSVQENANQKEASVLSEKFEVLGSRFQVLNYF